jgi:hypothetical protein
MTIIAQISEREKQCLPLKINKYPKAKNSDHNKNHTTHNTQPESAILTSDNSKQKRIIVQ